MHIALVIVNDVTEIPTVIIAFSLVPRPRYIRIPGLSITSCKIISLSTSVNTLLPELGRYTALVQHHHWIGTKLRFLKQWTCQRSNIYWYVALC